MQAPAATVRTIAVGQRAQAPRVPYQRMIRALVDADAEKQEAKG
jgi:hypothetical protein